MKLSTSRRRVVWCLLLTLASIVILYVLREPILRRIGDHLVREDPLAHADAIVVLAGATPLREIEAADLYRAGYAPRVLLTLETDEPGLDVLRARAELLSKAVANDGPR